MANGIDPEDPNDPWEGSASSPDPAFGDLSFPLWQPHVRLDVVRPESSRLPDRAHGRGTGHATELVARHGR